MNRFRSSAIDDEILRVRLLIVVLLGGLVLLLLALGRVQISRSVDFVRSQDRQSVRRVRIPGARGEIVDRRGHVLAGNRPSFNVVVHVEELRRPGREPRTIAKVEESLAAAARVIGRTSQVTRVEIETHLRKRKPLPMLAWRDLSEAEVARFAEQGAALDGLEIVAEPVRRYPWGPLAVHVLGYVGRAELPDEEEQESFHYYLPEMAGRAGMEKTMDDLLRGEAGGRIVRVDASGFRREDLARRPARAGADVMLTLDARVQRLAEDALAGEPGAAVVLDPATGEVLAMVSSPGYDGNAFVPRIPDVQWNDLLKDPRLPLMNRAITDGYAPGSTFKPVVAMAGLVNGHLRADSGADCPGYFMSGSRAIRCASRWGHGWLDLPQSLEKSCNVFYCRHGTLMGPEPIAHMATVLGLGRRTGIELEGERPGLVPTPAWKLQREHDGWREGDTCNLSIGQGAILVSPLQMAVVTAAFANGGRVLKPRLVRGVRAPGDDAFDMRGPVVANDLHWNASLLAPVREGMRNVIMSDEGSGRAARVPGLVAAGKTGTAEFGPRAERLKHTWMIAYAPADRPRYAMALVVDEGLSGGETAAPKLRALLAGLFPPPPPAATAPAAANPEGAG